MQCSGERPCARCIKREIAHLCTDEPIAGLEPAQAQAQAQGQASVQPSSQAAQQQQQQQPTPVPPPPPALSVTQSGNVDANGGAGAADMLNTLGLDMGDSLGGGTSAGPQLGGHNAFASLMQDNLFGQGSAGAENMYGASTQGGQQSNMFTPDFNLAMVRPGCPRAGQHTHADPHALYSLSSRMMASGLDSGSTWLRPGTTASSKGLA